MKNLKDIINEKLVINKNLKVNVKEPKTNDDLKREVLKKIMNKETDFNDIDVSNVTDFSHIFEDQKISEINISEWDVSNAETMRGMFQNCRYLKTPGDLSNWDVSKVEDMSFMFCNSTFTGKNGDISKWDVSKVEDMYDMFENSPLKKNPPKWYKKISNDNT